MTVTLERSPLAAALRIPGARAVALLDIADGATVVWRAGALPLGEREAAAAVTLAVAAAGLVAFSDPEDELGDVLVASAAAFHVLRLVGEGAQVAHLTLRRAGANLAMARHEFKLITEAYGGGPRPAIGAAPAPAPMPPPEGPPPLPGPPGSALPRRRPNGAPIAASAPPPTAGEDDEAAPGWLTMIGQPYLTDERVLDRILVTLRHL